MKAAGQKITMLTAYDYTMAGLLDAAGVEGILVGDSMSMVVQGHPNTLPVTLDEMIYHAEMVGRAVAARPGGRRHAVSQLSPGRVSRRSKAPAAFSRKPAARPSSSKAAPTRPR